MLFGLVTSMNRPGGNATGVNFFISETESKRIELLREVVPSTASFAYLINPNSADAENQNSRCRRDGAAAADASQAIESRSSARNRTGFRGDGGNEGGRASGCGRSLPQHLSWDALALVALAAVSYERQHNGVA